MDGPGKVTSGHLSRLAYLYIRQSSLRQVQENRESTARQYDLKRRAQALGWASEQIVVIDEDLGLSGASAVDRNGFQRLVAEVGLGRVGLVMGLEVSRLARNSTDWHRLLEICALTETLILDEDGIYDPSHFNDRLLLGLKGTMSEAELHMLRARMQGGLLNKARRGELWMRPPIGFVYDHSQRLVLDPDEQVQSAVRMIFDTFRRVGSALGVVRHFAKQGIRWPRRIWEGARAGELVFGAVDSGRVLNVLHNPRYGGAFVFGQTLRRKAVAGNRKVCQRRLPREQWKVFLPNAHPGYIAWAEFEVNQAKLKANSGRCRFDQRASAPREGAALLQGLVVCGLCGERMTVRHHITGVSRTQRYVCNRGIARAQAPCQSIPAKSVDDAVSQAMLESVTPASLDVAIEVFEELKARKAEVERLRRAQVERAREQAEFAQRQYMLVRPENRLVADNLERQWNEKLVELSSAEEESARVTKADGPDLGAEGRERIQALASDLPRVWKDPRTPMLERKRMLRLLMEDVTLKRASGVEMHIRWKGGATTSLEGPLPSHGYTPAATVEQIRVLATEQTDRQISQTLNARRLLSATGAIFTRDHVQSIRRVYAIPSLVVHLRGAGWLTAKEIADRLGIHPHTAKAFAREGVLRAVRGDDAGRLLFELPASPLPKAKRLRDRRRYPPCVARTEREVQYAA